MNARFDQKQTVTGEDNSSDTVRVWDIVVRAFHWSLVLTFTAVWLTSDDFVWLHKILGYAILGLVAVRIIWGFIGGKYARFTEFVKSPATVIAYLKDTREGHAARFLGHNPAGGAMITALLVALTITGITGWMSTTDAYWGILWVAIVHSLAADVCIILIIGHIAGVIFTSYSHGENLVKAMITGRKRRY